MLTLHASLILLLTHGVPILFFACMATAIWIRNPRNTEHILLSLICLCYLLLFAGEYVRNQVSITYSPLLSAVWFSNVGLTIPCLALHFLVKSTRLDLRMSRFLYPYVFYVPLILITINLLSGARLFAAHEFVAGNLWYVPVYNTNYYWTMTGGIVLNILLLVPLYIARSQAVIKEQRDLYQLLIICFIAGIPSHIILGFIPFGDKLPPYPYLYSGIIWCYLLLRIMNKHNFLDLYHRRYELLFRMNSDPILLVNPQGEIKEANPAAKRLLQTLHPARPEPEAAILLGTAIQHKMKKKTQLREQQIKLSHHDGQFDLLVNADSVLVDHEPHTLLQLRDITEQKAAQDKIHFYAYHDPLTHLPNRRYFHEKFEDLLQSAASSDERMAVLVIDLDRMKLLNDTNGHLAGDEMLVTAARLIRQNLDENGFAARMGGDEFVLVISGSPSSREIADWMDHLQRQFIDCMRKYRLPLGLSIGVSWYPDDGCDAQSLIHEADHAMFEMKRQHHLIACK